MVESSETAANGYPKLTLSEVRVFPRKNENWANNDSSFSLGTHAAIFVISGKSWF